MAASSSASQQPQHVIQSSNSDLPPKAGKKGQSRKGKGKESVSRVISRRQNDLFVDVDKETEESTVPWDWIPLTDSSASKVPPIFTTDGSYFFSLVGSSVKTYSVATGEVVCILSSPPAADDRLSSLLTTAMINPHNNFQLITGSLDGRIMVWDFLDAALLKIIDIGQPIHHMCAHKSFKDSVFVAVSRASKKVKINGTDDNAAVLRVSLRTTGATTKSAEIYPIGKTRFPTGLTFSNSGAWLIATAGHKVYVVSSSSFASGFTKYVSPERLTCLAPHPTDEYFATGDEKGIIRLWYCLSDNLPTAVRGVEKKSQTTTLHWHAHAVASITFTGNGAYLLSGGEESVLVIWQLHTGKREFVPRVGAPISTVSLSNQGRGEEEYLLGLADATYLFINAGTLKVSRSYSHIKLDPGTPSTSKLPSTPLAIHKPTSTIILPSSHPSSLQIYSLTSSKLVSELEISPSNRVSRRDERPVEPSHVEDAAITFSGEWLASVDTRDEEDGFRGEVYLKFWRWDQDETWKLNTRIDQPHGINKITCLAFSSSAPKCNHSVMLATTAEDCNVKIWGLKTTRGKADLVDDFWVIRSTFNFRAQIPRSVSWSPDASLLAISLGDYVSVYDSATFILRQASSFPGCKQASSVHFVGKGGRYLAVIGNNDLILWDLVVQSVRWHHKTLSTIENVVPHPEDYSFAVFCNHKANKEQLTTKVSIFHVGSPVPSAVHSIPFILRNISPYIRSSGQSSYAFIGITRDWHLVQFGDDCKAVDEGSSIIKGLTSGHAPQRHTLFQDIFGKSAFTEVPVPSSPPVGIGKYPAWTGTAASDAFESPAYLMPPLEHLFEPLLGRFLTPCDRTTGQPQIMENEEQEMDTNEDEQNSIISRVHRSRVVEQNEMDALATLFQRHTTILRPPGMDDQPPDTSRPKNNTVTRLPTSPLPVSSAPQQKLQNLNLEDVRVSSPVSAINGRKRKNTSD
ncbi:WD40-repeat-containing domain protein [Collybia nuda]|uniref:WD40-repeat-containing domain protein n=1 Tax=Collybia nuda TaxID=64659 RepID=A0A9P5YL80_9AGAR|nr:WD40-repeat-containing domain protein [Collybia nuda]